MDSPPPQYSPLPPVAFALPSYDETIELLLDDSLRLPTYQGRTALRYHPYLRIVFTDSEPVEDLRQFFNTIYDDSCELLEVPPHSTPSIRCVPTPLQLTGTSSGSSRPTRALPPVPLTSSPHRPMVFDSPHAPAAIGASSDQLRTGNGRPRRLQDLLPGFVQGDIQCSEAGALEQLAGATPRDLDAPLELFVVATENSRMLYNEAAVGESNLNIVDEFTSDSTSPSALDGADI